MADIPVDTLIEEMKKASTFSEIEEIRRHIMNARDEYSRSDFEDMIRILVDNEIRLSPRCPVRLTFTYYENNTPHFFTPTKKEMLGLCEEASVSGTPIMALLYERYPNMTHRASLVTKSTEVYSNYFGRTPPVRRGKPREEREFEERFRRRVESEREERPENEYPIGEREERVEREDVEYIKPNFNPEELTRPYEEEIRELEEQLKEERARASTKKHTSMTFILTPRQYSILTRTPGEYAYKLLRKEGRNYVVDVMDRTEGDIRERVDEIKQRAENELSEERKRRRVNEGQYSHADVENINRILCDKYEAKFPGYRCPSVLTTLSRRIAQFLDSNGLSWDSPGVDIRDIDLFLRGKPERIYTRELADEVFRNFVSGMGMREEETICDPEVMYPLFADLYALDILANEKRLDADGVTYRDEVVKSLTECGFRYVDYIAWADDADSYFRSIGTSFRNAEETSYEKFVRRYST